MNKERFLKLREECGTIWFWQYGNLKEAQLTKSYYTDVFGLRPALYRAYCDFDDDVKHTFITYLDFVFETKEDAEWYKDFTSVEKTIHLGVPKWSEVEYFIEQKKKFGLNHSDRVLCRVITKDNIYYLKLCKDLDIFTLQLKQVYIGEDLCEQMVSKFPVTLGRATEKEYRKACEKMRDLFLGRNIRCYE